MVSGMKTVVSMTLATASGRSSAWRANTWSRIHTDSGTSTIASADIATSRPVTNSIRPPAPSWFFCRIGGTGEIEIATSATFASNGRSSADATATTMIGMTTIIDSTQRSSSAGWRNR